jgi:hypothetical protein
VSREVGAAKSVGAAVKEQVMIVNRINTSKRPHISSIALSSNTGVWASWTNARSFDGANFGALNACQNAGGSQCVLTGYAVNQCVALAVDAVNWELWHSATGGGRIATVACTNASGPDRAFTGRVKKLQTS